MSTYFYADANNQAVGPYPLSQLKELARSGVIAPSTSVIAHGDSTWGTYSALVANLQQAEIAKAALEAAARQPPPLPGPLKVQRNDQASLEGVDWGAAFSALLLVVVHFFILPCVILKKCLVDLTVWGRSSRLPSSTSDNPVLTFFSVVLRAPIILLFTIFTVLWILYFVCTGQFVPFLGDLGPELVVSNVAARIGYAIGLLILAYVDIACIAFVFDCFSLAVGIANNVKKIAEKS